MVAVATVGIVGLGRITPTGFLPEDDQGALFVVAQLPGGASVARTTEVIEKAEAILREESEVEDITSVVGLNFIDNYSQSNAAFMVVTLKPFEERKGKDQSVNALIARLGQKFRQIQGANVQPLAPPPILGLGTGGGFTYVLEDLRGGDPKAMAQVLRGLTVAANQDPKLNRVFSTFSATNPSIYLDIDRDKAQIIGVPLNSVFSGAAGLAWGIFRQQHEPVRPHLASAGAGRSFRSIEDRRHLSHQRAQQRWQDDPAAQPCGGACRRRAAGVDPLQQSACRDSAGQPGARHIIRSGLAGDGCGCR